MNRVPSSQIPFVNQDKTIATEWLRFLTDLVSNPAPSTTPTVTASPMAFAAPRTGHLLVVGGTVSAISLKRGRATIATGMTSGFIPVSSNDIVTVTYTVAPTLTFVPL